MFYFLIEIIIPMATIISKINKFCINVVLIKIFNRYMSNQSNGMFGGMSKNIHRPNSVSGQQQRSWQLMQMQQPFTQQQSELISGMAGMTLHSLARATGSEILENGAELGVVNSSPAMSPNLPGPPHNMHSVADGHFIEDRKQQPQPIGTERARKVYNPGSSDNNWMLGGDNRGGILGFRWNNIERLSNLQRGQMYPEDIPPMMLESFQVSC